MNREENRRKRTTRSNSLESREAKRNAKALEDALNEVKEIEKVIEEANAIKEASGINEEEEPIVEEKIEIVKKEENPKKNTKSGFYYSFGMRITTNIIFITLLLIGFIYSIFMAFSITKKEYITYKEKSDIDYRIYLKDNNFYEQDYLGKDMAYVASLIDQIYIDYNYNFIVDKKSDLDIVYKIVAKLIIASEQNGSIFFTKEYDLTKETKEDMLNVNYYNLNKKNIAIDYHYYNDLANKFKSNYAVNTNSRLEVSLYVSEKNKNSNSYKLSNSDKVTLTIPLSEQEVNITFDNKNINNEKQIVNYPKFIVKDIGYAILSGALLLLIITFLMSLARHLSFVGGKKRSKYDKYISRLLRGYDRIIINVKTAPKKEDYNVIVVDRFQELIDLRDNTNQPINYYIVASHQKSEFFVINKNNLYLYTVKASDLDR